VLIVLQCVHCIPELQASERTKMEDRGEDLGAATMAWATEFCMCWK